VGGTRGGVGGSAPHRLGPVGCQHRAPGAAARLRPRHAGRCLMDPRCVRHRLGRAAFAGRAGRRQYRAPAGLPGRPGDVRWRRLARPTPALRWAGARGVRTSAPPPPRLPYATTRFCRDGVLLVRWHLSW